MTREESLKILRDVHDKALFSVRNALETLIPELRESEDERIRKGLIEALKTSKTVGELKFIIPEPTREECITYLEKQKELPLTDEAFKEQLERVLRDNVLDTDIRITGDTVIGAKINPEDKDLFLRSLSDEAILKECKERGLDVKYSEEKNLAYRMNWVMQDYYRAGKDEEEREHRFKCYKLFWDALADSEFFNVNVEMVTDPKTGEKYPFVSYKDQLQKSAEWSEEDEHNLNSVISLVHSTSDGAWGSCIGDRIENWLNSLRPSWKPSKEQMYILSWVANILLNHDGIVEEEVSKKLQSLYNDLKNLM